MKIVKLAAAAVLTASMYGASAPAAVLYNNGSSAYDFSAWTLSIGFEVSNSFTLANASTIDAFSFDSWMDNFSSIVTSIGWSISSAPFGTAIAGGTDPAGLVTTLVASNPYGFKVERNIVSIAPVALGAGTYYLNLGSAGTNDGGYVYWDINQGPSHAFHNYLGDLSNAGCKAYFGIDASCSSTFTVRGTADVPEPANWAMLIAGFGIVGAAMRVRRMAAA